MLVSYSKSKMSSENRCLICGHKYDPDQFKRNLFPPRAASESSSATVSDLGKDLYVYFILQWVVELPVEQLHMFLKSSERPEQWIKICVTCDSSYVKPCADVYLELLRIHKKFREVRLKLIEAIKRVQPEETIVKRRGRPKCKKNGSDYRNQVLLYVKNHHYSKLVETTENFLVGDVIAYEKSSMSLTQDFKKEPAISDVTWEDVSEEDVKLINSATVKVEPIEIPEFEAQIPEKNAERVEEDPELNGDDDWMENSLNVSDADSEEYEEKEESRPTKKKRKSSGKLAKSLTPGLKHNRIFKEGVVTCPECNKTYSSTLNLREHWRKVHVNKGKFRCSVCGKSFGVRYRYLRHMEMLHSGKKNFPRYFCNKEGCGRRFKKEETFIKHKRIHVNPELECDLCGQRFREKVYMEKHLLKHVTLGDAAIRERAVTLLKANRSDVTDNSVTVATTDAAPKVAVGETTEEVTSAPNSNNNDDGDNNDQAPELNSEILLLVENDSGAPGPRTCPVCGKDYASAVLLRTHVRLIHERQGEFKCNVGDCTKSFGRQYGLFRHLRDVHNMMDDRPKYFCSFEGCDKSFVENYQLTCHERKHNPPELECELCGKKFHFRKHLNAHLRRHPTFGTRNHQCPECPSRFSYPEDLATHVRQKHLNDDTSSSSTTTTTTKGVKKKSKNIKITNFLCGQCGLKFKTEFKLNRHISTQHKTPKEELRCSFLGCEKVFYTKARLDRHQTIHQDSESQRSVCQKCGKSFRFKRSLNTHLQRHEAQEKGQKDFSCDQCPCSYYMPGDLRLHIRLKHPESIGLKRETYTCPHCGVERQDKRAIEAHVRNVHRKKALCCSFCGKMIQNTHMRHHMQAMHSEHRITKPYKCQVCGKGFSARRYLRDHEKTHLPEEQKPKRRKYGKRLDSFLTRRHMTSKREEDEKSTDSSVEGNERVEGGGAGTEFMDSFPFPTA